MWQNLVSALTILVVGLFFYGASRLRRKAREEISEAADIRSKNRQRAFQLAGAGGFDPEHPERGGGIQELAEGDGMTRPFLGAGMRPAQIFGLEHAEASAKDREKAARSLRANANLLIVSAIAVAALRAWLLIYR